MAGVWGTGGWMPDSTSDKPPPIPRRKSLDSKGESPLHYIIPQFEVELVWGTGVITYM